jgi:Ca2+-binding RTX toxin-like protein
MAISLNQLVRFNPIVGQDRVEMYSELLQNNDRAGFENLGSSDNFMFRNTTTAQFINAQGGDDTIMLEGNTSDTVFGGSGDDYLSGGGGNDTLSGGSGNDDILGGAGADIISGGSGSDFLAGDNDAVPMSEHGVDTINGGGGDDTLYGGGAADILSGGTGNDTFLYRVGFGSSNESRVGAADRITDFQSGDRIDVQGINGAADFTFSETGASTQANTWWVEARDDGQHVFFNVNGGAPDMEIIVQGAQVTEDSILG